MKKLSATVIVPALSLSVLLISCASTSTPPPDSAVGVKPTTQPGPAQKARKERTILVKQPVLVKESIFYADGLLDEYITYKYNEENKILLEKATWDASRADPVERVVSETKDGKPLAETTFDQDGKLKFRREYAWNAQGSLDSERFIDAKGQVQSSSSYAYDTTGRKTIWKAFDGAGLLKAITVYSYGSGAQPTGIDLQNAGGKSTGTIKLEYAADGKLLKRSYFGPDAAAQKFEVYTYAAPDASGKTGGLISLETRLPDNSLAARIDYKLGELGQAMVATSYDGKGQVREIRKFEYVLVDVPTIEVYYE